MSNVGQERIKFINQQVKDKKTIEDLQDKNMALTTENLELESKVKKWEKMQERGYMAVVLLNDKFITSLVSVQPYSIFTFTQDEPGYMNSVQYKKFPFHILDSDGAIGIDEIQFKKYKAIGGKYNE